MTAKKMNEKERTWLRLGLKALAVVIILWLCFGVLVGLRRVPNISMNGRINDGDFVLFNRISSTHDVGDIVFYTHDGKEYLSEIVGVENDLITINDEGYLLVNGEAYSKAPVYDFSLGESDPFGTGIRVPKGSFFVLNSNYECQDDSRTFGTIFAEDIKGNVIALILRTRGF